MPDDALIRDHVFPIIEARASGDDPRSLELVRLRGTGFRVRDGRLGLTAAHVLLDPEDILVALFVDDTGWTWRALQHIQVHRREDVAAFHMEDDPRQPIFALGAADVRSSYACDVWGYPVDVLRDIVHEGRALVRPELVFSTGHVRRCRRPGDFLPGGGGSGVAEVDFTAGSGCSGSPVIGRDQRGRSPWTVAGIYLGEQQTHDGERRGFFLLSETFVDWGLLASPGPMRTGTATEQLADVLSESGSES